MRYWEAKGPFAGSEPPRSLFNPAKRAIKLMTTGGLPKAPLRAQDEPSSCSWKSVRNCVGFIVDASSRVIAMPERPTRLPASSVWALSELYRTMNQPVGLK